MLLSNTWTAPSNLPSQKAPPQYCYRSLGHTECFEKLQPNRGEPFLQN
jgi:hypothetical protein